MGRLGGQESLPTRVISLNGIPIRQIACGSKHSIALTHSGAIFIWGCNEFGQLGINDTIHRPFPTLLRFVYVQGGQIVC